MSRLRPELEKETKMAKQLDPTPASPTRPPKINIQIKIDDGRSFSWNFSALFAARRAIDFLISDRKTTWIDDNTLTIKGTRHEVTVSTDIKPDGLSDLMEYELAPREKAWELPSDYMRVGASMFVDHQPSSYIEPTSSPSPQTSSKRQRTTTPKPAKERKERPLDVVGLPDVIAGLDIDAKQARMILRKTNTPKPDHGRWEWSKDDATAIHAILKKNLKLVKK